MCKIYWTSEAELDLENILLHYLDPAGSDVAESIYIRIKERIGELKNFPERARPGRVPETREYVISRLPYIAIVHIKANTVSVLSLMHTARKYPPVEK